MPPCHRIAALVIAIGTALAAAGCGAATGELANRTFVSVAVTDGGGPKVLAPGTQIRLDFEPRTLSANAGCNTFGGDYRVDAGRLQLESGGMTAMGCPPDLQAQDQWLIALLGSKPAVRLVGNDLTLEGGSISIHLLDREVANPDLDLVGPTWTVESILDGDAVSSVPAGATASLTFKADGTVDLNAGCNRGSGTWRLDGGGITITGVALTKMACLGGAGELEAAVMRVLSGARLATDIDANVLTLTSGQGGLQLRG